jgi:hypothetical protein
VVFEKTATGWSAYAPDLPDLGVAGATFEKMEQWSDRKSKSRSGSWWAIFAYGFCEPQMGVDSCFMPVSI